MTSSQLTRLCRVWQRRLRLQDWDVQIHFAPASAMNGNEGHTRYTHQLKSAVIKIISPSEYHSEEGWEFDPEQTLVHELLHLQWAHLDKYKGLAFSAFEIAIDHTASALVELARVAKCAS